MTSTIIGQSSNASPTNSMATTLLPVQSSTVLASTPIGVSATFPIALTAEQSVVAGNMFKQIDFLQIPTRDIILLGSEVEISLHKTLDGFLERINQGSNPQIFQLITSLQDEVAKEDLGSLADRIMDAKPTFGQKLMGFFNKKSLVKAMQVAWEQTQQIANGKTKNLVSVITKMELQLKTEQNKLYQEIKVMDSLKTVYGNKYDEFVLVVAAISMLLEQSKIQVAELEAKTDTNNPQQNAYLTEQRDKLQTLESRCLALEGTLVSFPANQMVIAQLIGAGVTTLQETATTASARFASIKMTLLTINGAMMVKSVQQLSQQGANLDKNLDDVRSKLMNEVVTTAVSSIGDNRLAQANQIRGIIQDTKDLAEKVVQLKAANEQKFTQVRQIYDESRKEMIAISQKG